MLPTGKMIGNAQRSQRARRISGRPERVVLSTTASVPTTPRAWLQNTKPKPLELRRTASANRVPPGSSAMTALRRNRVRRAHSRMTLGKTHARSAITRALLGANTLVVAVQVPALVCFAQRGTQKVPPQRRCANRARRAVTPLARATCSVQNAPPAISRIPLAGQAASLVRRDTFSMVQVAHPFRSAQPAQVESTKPLLGRRSVTFARRGALATLRRA